MGTPVTLSVRGQSSGPSFANWAFVRIERVKVNDEVISEAPGEWDFGLFVAKVGIDFEWTPTSPGQHEITLLVRMAAAPRGQAPPAHPASPYDPPVLWTETKTLRTVIHVRP